MDGECNFCGRADFAARRVACADCQAPHAICQECADEAATQPEAYRLVALTALAPR